MSEGYQPTPEQVAQVRENHVKRGDPQLANDAMLRRSKDSAAMLVYWDRSDALIDGIDALRAGTTDFLPMFMGETSPEYTNRIKFTKYTNVYNDVIEGLANKPFEEEVTFVKDENKTVPTEIEEIAENIDGSGNNLTFFASKTFFAGINSAIDWIFVDAPPLDPNIQNRADEKAVGIRPYWSHVIGRNVYDVQSQMIAGTEVLTYMKIYEPGNVDHIREFTRLPTGVVTWQLYERREVARTLPDNAGETRFYPTTAGIVTIGVIPLVPFTTGKRDGRSWRFFPAMRGAVDAAIDLYEQESGLKWSKTLSAYAMLSGDGVSPRLDAAGKPLPIAVGPNRVLYSPPSGDGSHGTWKYVSPDPGLLKFLAEEINEAIKQLRELGRMPLTAQSNLTVINSAAAAGKSRSAVMLWALGLKDALENALVLTCRFMGITPEAYDPTVSVYTEFDEWTEGKDLETLDADRDRGDISAETLLEEKQRRGVYGAEFTYKRERERLLTETPGDGVDTREPGAE